MSVPVSLRVTSVCRVLPTPADPAAGTFVADRLAAMARRCALRALQPVPYCPPLRPLPAWARAPHRDARGFDIEPLPMYYLPGVLKQLDGQWLARSVRARLGSLRRAAQVDLLDAHFGYPDGAGCVQVAQELGLPVFITIRGVEVDVLRNRVLRPRLLRALRSATGCISVSHSLRATAVAQGLDAKRITVIPNAVNRELFSPGERAAARARLTVAGDARLVVCVGQLVSGKRHHVLLRAIARLRALLPAVRLVIVGGRAYEAGYPAELQRLVRELGLGEQVRILGRVPQATVRDWLRAADVFALATAREGCCNAVLEALAVGCPVVTTPVGDNPQYVHDGRNGTLVPVDDVDALAAAVRAALARDWDAPAISRGLQVGDWDQVAAAVLDYFTERLAEDARAGRADAHA
ncbi:MAG: glycosyltransferase [Proteobacteria bacterium]|nr:glycosyltransferase [Pseudomonadota bacterium]